MPRYRARIHGHDAIVVAPPRGLAGIVALIVRVVIHSEKVLLSLPTGANGEAGEFDKGEAVSIAAPALTAASRFLHVVGSGVHSDEHGSAGYVADSGRRFDVGRIVIRIVSKLLHQRLVN